jgi:predicted dehydrogenase
MRILVIGGGSIGRRHLMNLKSMDVGELLLVEPDAARRGEVADEAGVDSFGTLAEGLDRKPDMVVIATPSSMHVEQAIAAARCGCHLFIEKPLCANTDGLDELAEIVAERSLTTLVGCNMRFHPGPAKVKQLIDGGAIGRLQYMRLHTGSYLPGWRPWQDYRKSYSANRSMGGGVLLDCIHEIDLTRWYAGEFASVYCDAGTIGSLEIDTEDYAAMVFRHTNGVRSETHLDYISRTYERGCSVHGDEGTITWDFTAAQVRWYSAETEEWTVFDLPSDYDANTMYIDELHHFLACIDSGEPTTLPVDDATMLMKGVFAAVESASAGKRIVID